jgi:N-acyl-D-aspartate/D-glutamate deacylase
MSAWMLQQVVERGGVDTTAPYEDCDYGSFRATYRGYYLWWISWKNKLNIAWANDFDRWANSRVYEGESPTTIEGLDALLDTLTDEPRRMGKSAMAGLQKAIDILWPEREK